MSKKKIISVRVDDISPSGFEGTLADLKTRIQEWADEYGPTARVDWNPHFYYDYDANPSPRFDIYVDREETDEELAKRDKAEKDQKDAIKKRDLAEFERLKKQFGEE